MQLNRAGICFRAEQVCSSYGAKRSATIKSGPAAGSRTSGEQATTTKREPCMIMRPPLSHSKSADLYDAMKYVSHTRQVGNLECLGPENQPSVIYLPM